VKSLTTKENVEQLAEKIDNVLGEIKLLDIPESDKQKVFELKDAIESFHEAALRRLIKTVRKTEAGKERLYEAVEDPNVYAMLLQHGIIKQDLYTRVVAAMEEVRPYIQSHGGDIELDDVRDNVVYVQLHGACAGCSLSAVTLKNGVEEVIKERIPEIEYVTMVNEHVNSGFMPVEFQHTLKDTGWYNGPNLDDIEENKPLYTSVAGEEILFFYTDQKIMAFRNRCPHRGTPLLQESLVQEHGMYLISSEGGFQFDLTSGECMTIPHIQLEPFPVRIEDEEIWIRIE